MKDAIKTLYEHWINVHTTTPAEKSAFEVINEAAKGQAEHDASVCEVGLHRGVEIIDSPIELTDR